MSERAVSHDGYALSPMQKGMLFHQLFEPHSGADLEQMVMRFHERIDRDALAEAWHAVAQRHEVLRTFFPPIIDGEPIQVVQPVAPMEITVIDQAAYTEAQAETRLREFLASDRRRGFAADRAPLSRLTVFERASHPSVLVWSFHHIILDGRSFPIVLKDFFAAYDALREGRAFEVEPSIPYRDFIDQLEAWDSQPAKDYWRKTMAGFRAPTPLVVDGVGGVPEGATGFGEVRTMLDAPTTRALERFAEEHRVTLNTTLQGAWSLLLSTYSGETDVVFGATRSGRYGVLDGADTMAGLFINTLPMRVAVPRDADIGEWLRDIRSQHLALRDFEQLPLVDVQALSDIGSGTRMFDSILVFETYQLDRMMRERTGTGDRVDYELLEQTNHPLLLSVYGGEQLDLRLEFDQSMFDRATVERMVGHVSELLGSMVHSGAERVEDLTCLSAHEAAIVTDGWNPPLDDEPPVDLVTLWATRANESASASALVTAGSELTFADLDAASDQLAHHLQDRNVGPGQFVGILLDRSPEAIVAMLAVLKSGAAYLPLDPGYPDERLQYMVDDSEATVVITTSLRLANSGLKQIADPGTSTVPLLLDELEPLEAQPTPLPPIGPNAPAYMIYTSGSTGKPKGVVVSHDALANHCQGVTECYDLGPTDRVLQFAALSFDVAAEEIFPTLLTGATLVLRTDEVATSFEELSRFCSTHRITVLNLPAAFWSTWIDDLTTTGQTIPQDVRLVVTGSEKVAVDDYRRWQTLVGSSVRWLNAYGPTEATITASVYDPRGADAPPGSTMPIGRAIKNVSLHVLDSRDKPVPIGVPGELYIGGRGLALHYHQRPELTTERFITHTLPDGTKSRRYRTSDLARWLPDGTVEFLGRVDDQVKIRGFRIELGEIESALRDLDGVTQAAVVAVSDASGVDQLVGHVVAEPGLALDLATLRTDLSNRLPAYMVPVAFASATSLPLTPSGKIDRAALPAIEVAQPERVNVGPRTDLERRLVGLWTDVLGVPDIGVHDNFFDSGGNSLSAIRLFSSIKAATGEQVTLPELFGAPSIAELARLLGDGGTEPGGPARPSLPSWVFPVKASGSLPPLFHLGGASVLRSLADHLPEDQPLYALLEQDLDADHFYTTVDEIVAHCLEGLRAAQPEGPYFIAGLCFGGVVALEMSRQLQADGDEVGLAVMIDSFAPGVVDANKAAERAAEAIEAVPAAQPTTSAGRPSAWQLLSTRYHPTRVVRKLKGRAWRFAWGPMHNGYRRAGRPMPAWLRDVEEANTIASDSYRARSYDGDVTLVKATGNSEELEGGSFNGWDAYIHGDLTVTEVRGGHVSMYQEPNVAELAAELVTCLDRARRRV